MPRLPRLHCPFRLLLPVGLLAAALLLAACDSGTQATVPPADTLVPSLTPTPDVTRVPLPSWTPSASPPPSDTPVPLVLESEGLDAYPPPIDIDLPPGWASGFDIIVNPDIDGVLRAFPVAVYQGPVTDGTGTLVLLWGFQATTADPVFGTTDATSIYRDGLRLWRFLLNGIDCNIGTDLQYDFQVGGQQASGTFVSAVDCPPGPDDVPEPDVSGWFAGLNVDGLPFIFYAYTDPAAILGPARAEMQAILDTVSFRVAEALTATAPALTATAAAATPAP